MKRYLGWLSDALAVSLLLACAGAVGLWVRSHYVGDRLMIVSMDRSVLQTWDYVYTSDLGRIRIQYWHDQFFFDNQAGIDAYLQERPAELNVPHADFPG